MAADWMADAVTIANALRLADGCIRDARSLADQGSRNAAYMAEQGLEQIIRAIATSEQIHIERADAHQLDKTVRRFPADNAVKSALTSLVWLEAYATAFRYTTPSGRIPPAPPAARLSEAIEGAALLLNRIVAHFDVDLAEENAPARRVSPMRR